MTEQTQMHDVEPDYEFMPRLSTLFLRKGDIHVSGTPITKITLGYVWVGDKRYPRDIETKIDILRDKNQLAIP